MYLISQWSQSNLDIVFFIYGLAFVVMGISILVQPKKGSWFKLANILWLLAGFGLIHGTNEFLDMWAIIKGRNPVLDLVRGFFLVISYIFLFEFGRQLFRISEQKYLKKIINLFGWWVTSIIGLVIFIFSFISLDFWKIGGIWARYLLGFPGGLLVSLGLVLYYKYEEKKLEPLKVKKYFFWASLFFLGYGILSGLVVPKANFFPPSRLNTDSFLSIVHIPVQVFRAACSIVIAWATYRILRIFNWETVEKLQNGIAKLRETQDELIQAEKLSVIGQLASGVAHEVRNPLSVILQGVEYLEMSMAPNENVTHALSVIKDNIKRADNIIALLFDFSKKTAQLDLKPEDINSILESSLGLVKTRVKFVNVDVVKETKKDMPKALVDRNRMEQVFINVLLNAVQAMPEGGKIIIRSHAKQLQKIRNGIGRRTEDRFRIGERAVIVEIEDTGIGIPEENLKKVLDPFFTTKGPKGGAGLGLSVSQNIIAMHKGLLDVASQVGKGTKITIILHTASK